MGLVELLVAVVHDVYLGEVEVRVVVLVQVSVHPAKRTAPKIKNRIFKLR